MINGEHMEFRQPENENVKSYKECCSKCGKERIPGDSFCQSCGVCFDAKTNQEKPGFKKAQLIVAIVVPFCILVVIFFTIILPMLSGDRVPETTSETAAQAAPEQEPVPTLSPETTPEPTPMPTPKPTPELTPPPPELGPGEPQPATLDDVIFRTTQWVKISAFWDNGTSTVFERDRDAVVWTMLSREGFYRIVEPDFFLNAQGLFTIGFPTTNQVYIFYPNYTGSFGDESLTWSFETDPVYTRNSQNNMRIDRDLADELTSDSLMVIRIYFSDLDYMILYRDNDGDWSVRGRNVTSLVRRDLVFRNERGFVTMVYPNAAYDYVFYDNGTGLFGDEQFTWYYGYSDG